MKSGYTQKTCACLLVAASVVTASCSGEQEGETNGEFAGVGLSSGAVTAIGVVGGALLVGGLLADDDNNNTAVGDNSEVNTEADPGIRMMELLRIPHHQQLTLRH